MIAQCKFRKVGEQSLYNTTNSNSRRQRLHAPTAALLFDRSRETGKWYCATDNPEWIEFRQVIKTGALCDDVEVLPFTEPAWWSVDP